MVTWRSIAHRQLVAIHGHGRGTCRDCPHLVRKNRAGTWTKCGLTAYRDGRGTDWSVFLPACGAKTKPDLASG